MQNIKWKTCFRVGLTLILVYLCIFYWSAVSGFIGSLLSALVPLIIGCCIAYPLNILMSFYERFYFPKSEKKIVLKTRRGVCLVLAIITLIAIIGLVIWLVLPQLGECINLLIDKFPAAMEKLVALIEKTGIVPEDVIANLSTIDWQSMLGDIAKFLTSGLGSAMNIVINTVSSVASTLTSVVIGIIFAVYLLASKDVLGAQATRMMQKYMKPKVYLKAKYLLEVADESFHKFIVGQCIEAVILGLLCTLGMLLLQLPYAPMIGALTAFTSLIPVVGPLIGGGVGAFLILTQSPVQALIFLIFIVVLQQLEGNLIYPKVVGDSVGLPGIWVLAAVTVGAGIGGILGVLLGVPVASILYRLLKEDIRRPRKPAIIADVTTAEPAADHHNAAKPTETEDITEAASTAETKATEAETAPAEEKAAEEAPKPEPARKSAAAPRKSYPQKKTKRRR